MKIQAFSFAMLAVGIASAFTTPQYRPQKSTSLFPQPRSQKIHLASSAATSITDETNDAPELSLAPPRKICLFVEPTPFTHVSGYSNRFSEMLRYLSKAKDHVDILTVDSKTPEKDLPKEKFGYKIEHTQGFTFPLYDHISLSLDLPEMKGASLLEKLKPDVIHASGP